MSRTEAMLPSIAAAHRPAPVSLSNLQTTLLEHEYRELVIAAYLYGFPLFEQARVIYNFCYSPANSRRVPVNAFGHGRVLTGVKEQKVTTPNSDTLYSSAILDLSGGPIRLRVPAFGARYYSIAFIDAYTNVAACIGTRLQGGDGAVYLLSGPAGASPARHAQTIQFRCNHIAALVRIQADGPQEYAAVHALQDQLTLESSTRTAPRNPVPPALGDPQNFLAVVNQALGENPPAAAEAAFIEAFADIGLGPHLVPTAAQLQLWRDYFEMARNRLLQISKSFGRMVNGWEYTPPATGSFGTDYLARAVIGLKGLWANIPAEQTYTFALLDDAGDLLTGVRRYRLCLPCARARDGVFWSLSIYERNAAGQLFFFSNAISRHALGNATPDLIWNGDGSLDIAIQEQEPPGQQSNWLPAPAGEFAMVMRVYAPHSTALGVTEFYPPVQKLE